MQKCEKKDLKKNKKKVVEGRKKEEMRKKW